MNSELIIALVVLFVAIGLFVFAFVVMLRRTASVMHRAVAIGGHGLNKRETMMRVLESLNAEPKEVEGGIIQFSYWGENYLLYYADQSRHGWVMLADLYWAKYELNDANLSLVQEAVNEANGVTAPLATLFCLCDKDDGGITLHTRMPMPVTGGVDETRHLLVETLDVMTQTKQCFNVEIESAATGKPRDEGRRVVKGFAGNNG